MNYGVENPKRLESMTLPDGRRLAWAEWGPPDGAPVLFCTGAGMSRWLGFGAAEVEALAVRLIAFDRPGLGASDLDAAKTLESWAEDVQLFVRAHTAEPVRAVGFSQGAPFALMLGGAGVAKAVAVVSGQDDFSHPDVAAQLEPEVAEMVAAAQANPQTFERDFASLTDAAGLWQLVIAMSAPGDRAVFTSEPFGAAYRRALEEGFSQGAAGYARDLVTALSPWPLALEQLSIPVDLWYGAQDTSTVHSPDLGATMASRLSNSRRTVVADEGGSLLWTYSRDILTALIAHG